MPQTLCSQRLVPFVVTTLSYVFPGSPFTVVITLTVQDVGRNVCHGSDSVETAKNEIDLWFGKGEVIDYKSAQFDWIYEKP